MEKDTDIVAIWLKKDPKRWLAGALAGAFAGLVALIVASILSKAGGHEFSFAAKILAVPFLGGSATEMGLAGVGLFSVLLGTILFVVLTAFWGVLYAHFTGTNAMGPLLGMGLTWGAFSWIFINNLFMPSSLGIRALQISNGAAFFVWMVYGVTLPSVAFFDRMVRAKN